MHDSWFIAVPHQRLWGLANVGKIGAVAISRTSVKNVQNCLHGLGLRLMIPTSTSGWHLQKRPWENGYLQGAAFRQKLVKYRRPWKVRPSPKLELLKQKSKVERRKIKYAIWDWVGSAMWWVFLFLEIDVALQMMQAEYRLNGKPAALPGSQINSKNTALYCHSWNYSTV